MVTERGPKLLMMSRISLKSARASINACWSPLCGWLLTSNGYSEYEFDGFSVAFRARRIGLGIKNRMACFKCPGMLFMKFCLPILFS